MKNFIPIRRHLSICYGKLLFFLLLPSLTYAQTISIETGRYQVDAGLKLIVCNQRPAFPTGQLYPTLLFDKEYTFTKPASAFETGTWYEVKNNNVLYKLVFTNFPLVQISTKAKAPISNTDALTRSTLVFSDPAKPLFTANLGIKVRGNTSRLYPKLSYKMELSTDDAGANALDASLLDMREDSEWLLLAMYNEKLRINNVTGYELWSRIHKVYYAAKEPDARSAIRTRYCDVFVNNTYYGVYAFTEAMDRKQLKLKKTGDAGEIRGELYKSGNWSGATTFTNPVPALNATPGETWAGYEIKLPKEFKWENLHQLISYTVNAPEADFKANIGTKFKLDNLVDYFLFLNLVAAYDNSGPNQYIARYKENEPYFFITWDLDGTLGYSKDGNKRDSPREIISNGLFDRLLSVDPDRFKNKLRKRWFELRQNDFSIASLHGQLTNHSTQLTSEGAYEREAMKWASSLATSDLPYMKNWLERRVEFLDQYFGAFPEETAVETSIQVADFRGDFNSAEKKLFWSTTQEKNAKRFEIEFSPDGINFSKVSELDATGTSDSRLDYSFVHTTDAMVAYYRLKLVDTKDLFRFSDIIQLGGTPSSGTCYELNNSCSGNTSEIKTAFFNVLASGDYNFRLTYRSHEKPSTLRIRVNGGAFKTYNVNQISQYVVLNVGNLPLNSGTNSIEISTVSGFVCYQRVCYESASAPTACTPPNPPAVDASSLSITTGQSVQLTATGCAHTVVWNTGQTGNSISLTPTFTFSYSAKCQQDANCESGFSSAITVVVTPPTSTTTTPPATVTGNFEGYLDKVECGTIRGWVWDRNKPNEPLMVEFFANGQSIGTSRADIFRDDLLKAGKGNGSHVYQFVTPNGVKTGQTVSISAKVQNSTFTLKDSPKSLNCPGTGSPTTPPTNQPPQAPVSVAPLSGTVNVGFSAILPPFTDPENQPLTYTLTNLPAGFTFTASTRLLSGTPQANGDFTLAYAASDGGTPVSIPIPFTIAPQPAAPTNQPPQAPVSVAPLSGTVNVGFSTVLPAFTDPENQALTYTLTNIPAGLTFTASTRLLSGTPQANGDFTLAYAASDGGTPVSIPIPFTIAPQPTTPTTNPPATVKGNFEGYLDKVECGTIRGWVWDRDKPNTVLTVEFFANGISIGTTRADIFRQDIKDAGKGNGYHVYNFTTPASAKTGQTVQISAKVENSTYTLKQAPKPLNCAPNARVSATAETGDPNDLMITPNPTNGAFEVRFYSENYMESQVSVVDALGRSWYTKTVEGTGYQQHKIQLSGAEGSYLVVLRQGQQVRSKKILVVR